MIEIIYCLLLFLSLALFLRVRPIVMGAGLLFNTFYLLFYYLGTIIFVKLNFLVGVKVYYYLIIMGLYLVFFNVGYFIGRKKNGITDMLYDIVQYRTFKDLRFLVSLSFAVLFFLFGLYFFRYGIPVFSDDPDELRKLDITGATISFLSLTLLAPITFLIGVAGNRVKENLCFLFFLAIDVLTAFKSAVARWIVIFFMYREIKFNFKRIIIIVFMVFMLMFFIVYLKFKSLGIEYAFYRFYMRLFYANPHDLWYVLSYFPDVYGFLWGKAFLMDLISLRPGKDLSFDGWMYQEIYNTIDFAGINSSVGELWADWSIGAFLIILIWGYFLGNWDSLVLRKRLLPQEKVVFSVVSLMLSGAAANLYKAILVLFLPFLIYFLMLKLFSYSVVIILTGRRINEK